MRILHLVAYPWHSGPAASTVQLALAQRELGCEVNIAADRERGEIDGFEEALSPVLRNYKLEAKENWTMSRRCGLYGFFSDWRQLRHLHDYDMVHLHGSHEQVLWFLAQHPKLKSVRTLHHDRFLQRAGFWDRWFLEKSQGIIVRHPHALERFDVWLKGLKVPRQVIYGCVPTWLMACGFQQHLKTRLETLELRRSCPWPIPEHAWVIGQVALLDGRGQQELLKAVALTPHPEWHVLLVGDGRQKAALIKLAQQYKIAHRVHFTGYLSKSQLYQAYRVMDATFLAQAGNDASVRAAMEALFLHVPLVAVQGSALDEWVHENRWGVGVPQLHPAWIATKLLHMHEHYDEFCAKARDCGEYLRGSRLPEHEARETLAFYKKVGNL